MLSVPEIASRVVDKALSEISEDCSRTIFMVGSKLVGKSTLLVSFLEKNETPRPTLVLEYSFGRKAAQKHSIEKTVCHVWEYGGKLEILRNVLSSVPVLGKYFYCIMVDLSKIKNIWNTLETCILAMNEIYSGATNFPESIIIGGKYDLFKNYDSEIKKFICTTIRSVALEINAHVIFHSAKEPQLAKKTKDMLYSIGFGNGFHTKEKNVNYTKPLFIPKGSDTWENIGITQLTLEKIKMRHIARIPPEIEGDPPMVSAGVLQAQPEPVIDCLASSKYEEIRNMDVLDVSVNDYLLALHV